MLSKYQKWVKTNNFPPGSCLDATLQMNQVFPELKRVKGTYIDPEGKRHTHWWCLDGDNIIDPTASQFALGGIYECWRL